MTRRIFTFTNWWLTGFTQADGSFVVNFERRKLGNLPYRCRPVFILTQSLREIAMIKQLHEYLGVGTLQMNRNCVNLVVQNLDDIINVILPHFDAYPCRGRKHFSYLIFRKIVLQMKDKKHLDYVGFLQILDLGYFTHATSVRTPEIKQIIINAFFQEFGFTPEYTPMSPITMEENTSALHPDFVIGLTDGDGSFNFSFRSDRRRVVPNYTVVQDDSDYSVLLALQAFFGCGEIYKLGSKSSRFQIENADLLVRHVQPVMLAYHLNTVKQEYLGPCFEAWSILQEGGKISNANLVRLMELVYDQNLEGKRRKYSKSAYIERMLSNISITPC